MDRYSPAHLDHGLLIETVILRFGVGDAAVPLEGLKGRAGGRGAVPRLQGLRGSLFGLQHTDDIFSGLGLQK